MKENTWLITFPHAGGSSTIFKGWNKEIKCNVLNLDYPGHWTRMCEPLLDSFNELAMDAVKSIQNKIKTPADSDNGMVDYTNITGKGLYG